MALIQVPNISITKITSPAFLCPVDSIIIVSLFKLIIIEMTSLSDLCSIYYHISFLQRERNTTYLRRWFVLKGNLLFYQERPGDRSLLGVIVLEGCMVQACETDGQFCFSLVFTGPGLRTYRLAADDHLSQESWIGALFSASHIYLSMIVRDLERRYEGAFICMCFFLCLLA